MLKILNFALLCFQEKPIQTFPNEMYAKYIVFIPHNKAFNNKMNEIKKA